MRLLRPVVALCLALISGRNVVAEGSAWRDQPVDIAQYPDVKWGSLPNGVRYAVMPHATPKGRLSLRLLVAVGSLWESNSERGIAHFIEHMAFRGTAKYPETTLLPTMERLGMGLGADSAAFTSYDYTVFQLELPDTLPATLDTGIDILHEFATAITFDPIQMLAERGVVLSEMRERDTPGQRTALANNALLWPNSRFARRSPIGLESTVTQASASDLRRFYNAWYRPERLAIIAVGDAAPDVVIAKITAAFRGMTARSARPLDPPELYPSQTPPPKTAAVTDAGWAGATLIFEHAYKVGPAVAHPLRRAELQRRLAVAMYRQRLEAAAHRAEASFVQPSISEAFAPFGWRNTQVSASVPLVRLPDAIADFEQEHRRAMQYGFVASELAIAKATLRTGLATSIHMFPTRSSPELAAEIEGHLLYGTPLITPTVGAAEAKPDLEAITLADCNAAFRSLWPAPVPAVVVIAQPHTAGVSSREIAQQLNASFKVKVKPPVDAAPVEFAYSKSSAPGALAHDDYQPDLQLHLAAFANGTRLNFKSTTFDAGDVEFCVRVGDGQISAPDRPALMLLADYGVIRGGLGRHSAQQMTGILASHDAQIAFQAQLDTCLFYGRCARSELEFALRLLSAYLTDPGFRSEELSDVRAAAYGFLASLNNTAEGPITLHALFEMTGFDYRFRPAGSGDIGEVDYDLLARWLKPQLTHGPVEMAITGDISWEEAKTAFAGTIGAIAPRPPPPPAPHGTVVHFAKPHARGYRAGPAVRDAALMVTYAVPEVIDVPRYRRCDLLAGVLNERIFAGVRQQLGASYSPTVDFVCYGSPPGLNYFEIKVETQTQELAPALRIIQEEVDKLRNEPIDRDTFERVHRPLVRAREDMLRTNSYWLYTVLEAAQSNPSDLAAARSRAKDLAAMNPQELGELARRYFVPANQFSFASAQSFRNAP